MMISAEETNSTPQSVWRLRWRRLARDRVALAAAVWLAVLMLASLGAGLFETFRGVSGIDTDLLSRFEDPSALHLLGTDEAGRDELARLLRGGRVSLAIGAIGALVASCIGLLIGATAGYARGIVDQVLMRFTDFMISLPGLPLLIILAAIDLTKLGVPAEFARSGDAGFWRITVIVTLLGWTGVARLARATTLALREADYVLAARAQGASAAWVLRVHIVPNAISPVIVATTLAMGRIILTESALSFLGVGIQPPMTSWGSMLNNAQDLLVTYPPLAFYPGLAILTTVVAINFLGDGLQRAFDPRSESRAAP